ncbi:MAG: hypothetical protein ACK5GN_05695 [Pseudomonadota bacterium]
MKLVSPESLTDQQRTILEGYSRFFPSGAVCVNVMLGSEPWDLRPLLLLLGKVHIARFSMTLTESSARAIASQLESFSVLCNSQQRGQLLPGEGRIMLLRPYFPDTLRDDLEKGRLSSVHERLEIVRAIIRHISELSRRRIAHGHICPANIIRDGSEVILVDPVVGALHQTTDSYLAPETVAGHSPEELSDLFGLGRTAATLLGDNLTAQQRAIVEKLLLPSPRQRPLLEEVSMAFGASNAPSADETINRLNSAVTGQTSTGRLLKPAPTPKKVQDDIVRESEPSIRSEITPIAPQSRASWVPALLMGCVAVVGGVWVLKDRYPALYFEIASRVPMLAAQHSAQYEEDWASRDRARMAIVGRAGVIRREPAAINTITNSLNAGENPEGVHGALIRVAFSDGWRDELTPVDKHAALVFALEGLVPEGRAQMAPVSELHPGVVLAVLGQLPLKNIPNELRQLPISVLAKLPAPFGGLFSQAKEMGLKQLGEAPVIGLAQIVTGNAGSQAFERFIGPDSQAALTLAKVSLIMPVLSANETAAAELLGVLGDRGGDITTLVGWFDLVDIAGWGSAKPSDKVSLVLGAMPSSQLSVAQLADLLTFPLEKVRNQAVLELREAFPGQEGERFLVTLSTPAIGLNREQTISLVSALALSPQARAPFIPAWFNLEPAPDAVVLILLARSSADAQDVFNLEAARYLRRTSWKSTNDILKLLAGHPEPLARVLAYGRLDPAVDEGRSILLERQRVEKDDACLKVLKDRLASIPKPSNG